MRCFLDFTTFDLVLRLPKDVADSKIKKIENDGFSPMPMN